MIKLAGVTTGEIVASKIHNICDSRKIVITHRNVQRRVYDALNVLVSLGYCYKEASRIYYIGDQPKTVNHKLETYFQKKSQL